MWTPRQGHGDRDPFRRRNDLLAGRREGNPFGRPHSADPFQHRPNPLNNGMQGDHMFDHRDRAYGPLGREGLLREGLDPAVRLIGNTREAMRRHQAHGGPSQDHNMTGIASDGYDDPGRRYGIPPRRVPRAVAREVFGPPHSGPGYHEPGCPAGRFYGRHGGAGHSNGRELLGPMGRPGGLMPGANPYTNPFAPDPRTFGGEYGGGYGGYPLGGPRW